MTAASRAQRAIGAVYSWAADRVYEPVVVKGTFRLFGRDLEAHVAEQGRRAVEVAAGSPILDIPVGTAYFSIPTARRHDGLFVGADYATGMTVSAGRAARAAGVTNLEALQADIHQLPFPDRFFRVILCTNGLQVIPDLPRACRELARVLASGGSMFVSVVSAPIDELLPRRAGRHLPTIFRSGRAIVDELRRAGLAVVSYRRARLAHLIEATRV